MKNATISEASYMFSVFRGNVLPGAPNHIEDATEMFSHASGGTIDISGWSLGVAVEMFDQATCDVITGGLKKNKMFDGFRGEILLPGGTLLPGEIADSSDLGAGAIAGIVAGGLAVAAALGAVWIKARARTDASRPNDDHPPVSFL
jgi:hypothetical protein